MNSPEKPFTFSNDPYLETMVDRPTGDTSEGWRHPLHPDTSEPEISEPEVGQVTLGPDNYGYIPKPLEFAAPKSVAMVAYLDTSRPVPGHIVNMGDAFRPKQQ